MNLTLAAAVGLGIRDAMAADSSVYVMGEDVALMGGIFGVTKGLHETFGESLVFDTPISEGGFLTAAVGSAMMGAHPVVEVQLMDFIMVAMDFPGQPGGQAGLRQQWPDLRAIGGPDSGGSWAKRRRGDPVSISA